MTSWAMHALMGRYEDWNLTRPKVVHLLHELDRAHIADGGERFGGHLLASAGLSIAITADEGRSEADTVGVILHHLHALAARLTDLEMTDVQDAAVTAIFNATSDWRA